MAKKNIALLAGGNSSEDVISYQSAEQLSGMIDNNLYNIFIIKIKGKDWIYDDKESKLSTQVDKNNFTITLKGENITFDCAFIAIHGTPGEDGLLQAYFEMLKIPYSTCGVLSSAITFNKYHCKQYLEKHNIRTAKTIRLFSKQKIDEKKLIEQVGLPCFVKPNEAGSSFGISKVNKENELPGAIKNAFKEDNEVLVETYIEGREITCGLIKTSDKTIIFPITEVVSTNDFFDLEAKYTPGKAEEITPAQISGSIAEKCKALSSKIYDVLDCRGIVRIDYILSNEQLYFLETNTVPGMSAASIIPQQIRAMGLSTEKIFTMVIEDSIKRMENE